MDTAASLLKYLGCATALTLTYRLGSFVSLYLRPSTLSKYQHSKPGSTWALVTGASDGIGYGFVTVLLDRGFNVLLHGRNEAKLTRIISDLEAKHPSLRLQYVIADASASEPDTASIVKKVESLPGPLTVLVNNVGGIPRETDSRPPTTTSYVALQHMTPHVVDGTLNMNARFPSLLTAALAPLLIENGPSLILNTGSLTGLSGLPYLSIYSGAKAFNLRFSEAVRLDLRETRTEVLGLLIGNVVSAGNKGSIGFFTPSSVQMAGYALDRVGCGQPLAWAWWRHALQYTLVHLMPTALTNMFILQVMDKKREMDLKAL